MTGVELLAIGLLALLFVYIGLVLWGMGTLTAEEAERAPEAAASLKYPDC